MKFATVDGLGSAGCVRILVSGASVSGIDLDRPGVALGRLIRVAGEVDGAHLEGVRAGREVRVLHRRFALGERLGVERALERRVELARQKLNVAVVSESSGRPAVPAASSRAERCRG